MFSETRRQIVHVAMSGFALLLVWLTWWQAALCAAAALLFNVFVLPRAAGQTLSRPTDRTRGYPLGILLYPLSVLLLILAFPSRPDIAAAAWGILAWGDGIATLAGRAWGRRALTWNREKTLEGTLAFFVAAAAAGTFLAWWTAPAVSPAPLLAFTLVAPVVAAGASALAETMPIGLDDNITVPAVAGAVLWGLSQIDPVSWQASLPGLHARLLPAIAVNTVAALAGWRAGTVRMSGMIGGWVSGVVVFAVDTTERQRAEEKLRANEALLRAAFDHAPFEFWVRDRNEVCILQNAALKRHWGDILGKRPEEANISPEALAIWQANNRRAFAGEIVQGDIKLHEGQAVRWMHNVIAPIRVGGEIQGIVGFNLDITDRVLAEAQIRESEQLYRSIVEGAQEGIWRTDAQWRITFVNPRLTEMLGYTEEEMKGRSILDFMDAEERAVAPAKMFVREQGRRATHEAKFRCKDGTELWALVSGNPLRDEHGHFAGTLALLTDITDRKRSERVLQKYTEALRTLSRRLLDVQEAERHALARELHDEVGQNLTTLKLALDRSLERQGEPELATLQRARAVLRELVARVRNLSLDLRPAMLDDLGLVPALLWQFERYTAQTHIEVRFMHSRIEGRRFGPHVETAAYRVVQEALTNVARHAGVTEVAVRLSASDGLLRVQIQDQGRGFDPAATLAAGQSSGLRGMQERASLLGGKLQINSDPGAGTLVLAEFPFQETEKA